MGEEFDSALAREHAKTQGHPRSSLWHALRLRFAQANPTCAACGGMLHLQVHHVEPVHLFPDLELAWSNLISLCESPGTDCHLHVGHGGEFKAWNPTVREDAVIVREMPERRAEIIARAQINRRGG